MMAAWPARRGAVSAAVPLLMMGLALSSCARRAVVPAGPPGLAVMYASDLRGHYAAIGEGPAARGGLARRATRVDEARLEARDVVLVDAGDAVASAADETAAGPLSPDALVGRARMILLSYRRMGVGGMVPGERELSLGPVALRALEVETKVPLLAANVRAAPTPPSPGAAASEGVLFEDSRLITGSEHLVTGILGVVDLSADVTALVRRAGFVVTDAAAAARAVAASLRARGASFVIVLVHTDRGGVARARELLAGAGLAEGALAVDVVVVGHDAPTALAGGPATRASRVARPALVQAGALGATLGRLDAFWSARDGAGAPVLEDRTLDITGTIREQHGVALIGRVLTTRIIDNGRMANEATPGKSGIDPELAEKWDYGSNSGCMLCHEPEATQWKTTDHAHALQTLEDSGHGREPGCLGCHMTGFLSPGGTRNMKTARTYLADVGCECCHGPSALHMRSNDRHLGTSRKVAATVCLGCHTPDQSRGTFDYAAALKAVLGPGHGAPAVDGGQRTPG